MNWYINLKCITKGFCLKVNKKYKIYEKIKMFLETKFQFNY